MGLGIGYWYSGIIVMCLVLFSPDSRAPGEPASSSNAETTDQTDGQNSQLLKLQCDRARCEAEQAKREALDAKQQAKVLGVSAYCHISCFNYFFIYLLPFETMKISHKISCTKIANLPNHSRHSIAYAVVQVFGRT